MRKNKKFSLLGLTWKPMRICFVIASIPAAVGLLFCVGQNEDLAVLMFVFAILPFLTGVGVGVLESMRYEFASDHIKTTFAFLPAIAAKRKYADFSEVVIAYALVLSGWRSMECYITSNISVRNDAQIRQKKKLPMFMFFLPLGYDTSKLLTGMAFEKERKRSLHAPDMTTRFDFAAFQELLRYTDLPIRILEDVYLENATAFDESIERIPSAAERCFVVSGSQIPYVRYKELERMRKEL